MLANSFIFLDRIGQAGEKNLWKQGLRTWQDFLDAKSVIGIGGLRKAYYDRHLSTAKEALSSKKTEYFNKLLGLKHSWRLWKQLGQEAVFLDIETTGGYGNITLIGLYDGLDTKIMVRGFNLDKKVLRRELEQYSMIVTFNGASFDLPVIRRYFGHDTIPDLPHIDLRGVCSQIGLRGGLKSIEKQIGIRRPADLEFVYGDDAAFLWHKWENTHDKKYLDILIRYNEEDIMNLKPLAEHAITRLWEETFIG